VIGGQVRYTSSASFVGVDAFDYTICDDRGACDTASVQVTVDPAGTAPTANADTASTVEDIAVLVDVLANDTDPDGDIDDTTLAVSSPPGDGVAVVVGDQVRYTPAGGFVGTDAFDYRICDADGTCATATVTVDVTAASSPPNAVDDTAVTGRSTAVLIDVLANDSDVDGDLDPTSLSVTTPASGTATTTGQQVSYDPNNGFSGTDTFSYTVCDLLAACDTATVTVTVGSRGMTANPDAATTAEFAAVTITVLSNDTTTNGFVDATSLSVGSAGNGTTSRSGDAVVYQPAYGWSGVDTFTYDICDDTASCDTGTVTVTVVPGQAPIATDDSEAVDSDKDVKIKIDHNDIDPDGDIDLATVTIVVPPTSGRATVFVESNNKITYTPDGTYWGTDTFTYRICDVQGLCDTAIVTVTVVPQAVKASDDAAMTSSGTATTIDVVANDSDVDGDIADATVVIASGPSSGRAIATVLGDMRVRYTPDAGYSGVDTFDYRICDTQALCDTATVTVTVDGPFAAGQMAIQDRPAEDAVVQRQGGDPGPTGSPTPTPAPSGPTPTPAPSSPADASDADAVSAPTPAPSAAPVEATPTEQPSTPGPPLPSDLPEALPARREEVRVASRRRPEPGTDGP
jgi:hypothetical protein